MLVSMTVAYWAWDMIRVQKLYLQLTDAVVKPQLSSIFHTKYVEFPSKRLLKVVNNDGNY